MSALMPTWPDAPRSSRNLSVLRIRRALAARGYCTPEPFRREHNPPQEWSYDDDDVDESTGTPPVLWAWTVPYHPVGRPHELSTLHAPTLYDALYEASQLPEVRP